MWNGRSCWGVSNRSPHGYRRRNAERLANCVFSSRIDVLCFCVKNASRNGNAAVPSRDAGNARSVVNASGAPH